MTEVEITEATQADLLQIVGLLADDSLGRVRENPAQQHRYQRAFQSMTNDPNCLVLVARLHDTIVGCLQMNIIAGLSYQGAKRCLIEDVRVANDLRQQGIGRKLIAAALDQAKGHGCEMAELFAHADRSNARAFYQALGFISCHRGFRIFLDQD